MFLTYVAVCFETWKDFGFGVFSFMVALFFLILLKFFFALDISAKAENFSKSE